MSRLLTPGEFASLPDVGEIVPELRGLSEPARAKLWLAHGGQPFDGPVGDVRRLARVIPLNGHPLPFKIPFLFTMDGPGTYFGDDLDGLFQIFGGRSRLTRVLWGKLLMGNRPAVLICDVALGRTSFIADLRGLERILHLTCAWARIPIVTPARFYYGWRRRRLSLDSYEVHGVQFFPRHGHYTVVTDPRRIIRRYLFASPEEHRAHRSGARHCFPITS